MNTITRLLAGIGFALAIYPFSCLAQPALPVSGTPVVLSGTVPDEASRAALVASARALYGTERVVDRLQVGGVTPPPNWSTHVKRLLNPDLKQVHQGQLQVIGTRVTLRGKVANEALRQQIASTTAASLTPAYVVNNALVVGANAQAVLDQTLADRVVEFESGSAVLTAHGRLLLDEMAASIVSLDTPHVQVVGHTDSAGNRLANIGLSLERANAVRDYLVV
ncbi:MAG: cell envelope biogenesis protein OmpA, partial [Betaproteobacteria bacterium HGW-Betaproteobacteria-21]